MWTKPLTFVVLIVCWAIAMPAAVLPMAAPPRQDHDLPPGYCDFDRSDAIVKLAQVTASAATTYDCFGSPLDCNHGPARRGDVMAVYRVSGTWACGELIHLATGEGAAVWMKSEALRVVPALPHPAPGDWEGVWQHGAAGRLEIRIAAGQDHLHLEASAHAATTAGTLDAGRFVSEAAPIGHQLLAADGACQLEMTLFHNLLLITDNRRCAAGKANLSGLWTMCPGCQASGPPHP